MITFTEEKKFTKEQVQQLFLSVNWMSGNYPERLYKALMNSSTVLTAWENDSLVGLIRVLDDTEIIDAMPENKANVPFYEKYEFSVMGNSAAIQICNYGD